MTWGVAIVGLFVAAAPEHAATRSDNVALGVGCEHCHTAGNFSDTTKPAFDFARRMARMVQGLNDGPLQGLGGVTCWSCYRGQTAPPRLPRADWESIAAARATDFAGRDDLSLAMSVYSASLGVACSHCHVDGDWRARSKRPHQTVARTAPIFDLIPIYFDSAIRAPRTQCYMCHQGRTRVERARSAAPADAPPPTLARVLDRAAWYVAEFERQLTGIAADETYTQSMGIPGRHGEFIATTHRDLKATLVLVREGDEGYLEARDVREVDGVPVRDRAAGLAARAAADARRWSAADKMLLRSENARYNIGDIVRTINTPLLALQVLRRQNQSRFSFSMSTDRAARVGGAVTGDTPGVFRVATDVWVIGFRERAHGTLIRTETGRDVPCRGRLWIDAGTGRVMMTEMIVDSRQVEAHVTVSFQSEPLLGLLPPIEMHEHYRAAGRSQTIVEASASYGPFHLITSQTPP